MHSKYYSWSLLDPRPICFYEPHTGTDLCVWNGVYMTRTQAMMIACEKYMGIWPTPTMKNRAWNEFVKAYFANAFGHKNWTGTLTKVNHGSDHYNMLKRMLVGHLNKMQDYTGPEVMSWFNYQKERTEWISK